MCTRLQLKYKVMFKLNLCSSQLDSQQLLIKKSASTVNNKLILTLLNYKPFPTTISVSQKINTIDTPDITWFLAISTCYKKIVCMYIIFLKSMKTSSSVNSDHDIERK